MPDIISDLFSDVNSMQEPPFQKGDRIRIKDYVDPAIYDGLTTVGNEAWIRAVKEDRWGLPMLLIEWDRNHWTYNGAPDGWTFADHFEKVESDNIMPEEDAIDFSSLLENIRGRSLNAKAKAEDEIEVVEGKPVIEVGPGPVLDSAPVTEAEVVTDPPVVEDNIGAIREVEDALNNDELNKIEAERDKALDAVLERLSESDAFIVIGVDRFDDEDAEYGGLSPYSVRFSLNRDSEIVAEAFLSTLAGDAYQELAIKSLLQHYESLDNGEPA